MGFFGAIGRAIKKVGVIGSHVVKTVGPHIINGLRHFSSIAGDLGNAAQKVSTGYGHPNIGMGIQKGLDIAGRVAGGAAMAGHMAHYGSMRMPG